MSQPSAPPPGSPPASRAWCGAQLTTKQPPASSGRNLFPFPKGCQGAPRWPAAAGGPWASVHLFLPVLAQPFPAHPTPPLFPARRSPHMLGEERSRLTEHTRSRHNQAPPGRGRDGTETPHRCAGRAAERTRDCGAGGGGRTPLCPGQCPCRPPHGLPANAWAENGPSLWVLVLVAPAHPTSL